MPRDRVGIAPAVVDRERDERGAHVVVAPMPPAQRWSVLVVRCRVRRVIGRDGAQTLLGEQRLLVVP